MFIDVDVVKSDTSKIALLFKKKSLDIETLEELNSRLKNEVTNLSSQLKEAKTNFKKMSKENETMKNLHSIIDSLLIQRNERDEIIRVMRQTQEKLQSELMKAEKNLKEMQKNQKDQDQAQDQEFHDIKPRKLTSMDQEKLMLGDFATQYKRILGRILGMRIEKVEDLIKYVSDPLSNQDSVQTLRDMDFGNKKAIQELDNSVKRFMDMRNELAHPAIFFQNVTYEELEKFATRYRLESQFNVISKFWSKLLDSPKLRPGNIWLPKKKDEKKKMKET